MLQEEVKKALQEGRPVPPEGFEERSTAQVLRLTSEEKAGRRLPRAAVVLCTLLLVLGLATALASTVESVNERLYAYWPELAELLMPVNGSSESLGIRMEVDSAVVKDDTVIITYSLQDLEGDRLNAFTEAPVDATAFPLESTAGLSIDSGSVLLSYDTEARRADYVQEIRYGRPIRQGEYRIPLRIPSLTLKEVEVTDLHALLARYGDSAATLPASQADARYIASRNGDVAETPETLQVLDYTRNTEIPLNEHVSLSGIGWIDGLLHVQLHYTDNGLVRTASGEDGYCPVSGHILMQLADGWSPLYTHSEKLPDGIYFVRMGDGEVYGEWEEYIFPCDPAEAQAGRLEAQITRNDTVETLEGGWSVEVPLRLIQSE